MKKTLLFLIVLICGTRLLAQKIEYSIQANTGVFYYSGNGSVKNAGLAQSYNNTKNGIITIPYSRTNTASYGFSGQAQLVTKDGFIAGLQAGYEILRSKSNIDTLYPAVYYIYYTYNINYSGPVKYPANGNAILTNTFINLNPYIGYRFKSGSYKFDVLPGADIGMGLSSHEKGKVISNDLTYLLDTAQKKPLVDVRLKLGIVASYKHYGLNASYAHGLSNYERDVTGSNVPKVYSELFRFGLSYRF